MSPPPSRPLPLPGSLGAWVLATRPPTLVAAVVPVAVGAACAAAVGEVRWGPTAVALVCALLIQVGTNFANDVFDYEKGADTADRLGPTRAVQAGLLAPAAMRRATVAVFAGAFVAGLYLAAVAGWPLLVVGVLSILAGVAYTGGPLPLGYHGLGDLFVLVFFGFVAVGATAYVSLGTVPTVAVWAGLAIGLLAANLLVVNNVRDRIGDRAAGKRTLAVRFGRPAGVVQYGLSVLVAHAVPVGLWLAADDARPWLLLPVLTLPWAALLTRQVAGREGRALNESLIATVKLLFAFGLLLAAGLALAGDLTA